MLPEPTSPANQSTPTTSKTSSAAALPRYHYSAAGSAFLAVGGAGALGALLMGISTQMFESYGWSLFVIAPFICGMAASMLYNWRRPVQEYKLVAPALWTVTALALCCTMFLLLMSGIEGVICIIMAFPIALVVALFGAGMGQAVAHVLGRRHRQPLPMLAATVLLYPAVQAYENQATPPPLPHEVVTQQVVAAPPARVWTALVQPVTYPGRVGLLFRAGVAYPTHTRLRELPGGVHWLRVAYSGRAVTELPVTRWEPGRELAFTIPVTPAPMQELSPYPRIHAPHLHGYFRVATGSFRLRPLPGGRTLLEARTVYQHSIGPRDYWQLWSDYLLDDMHARVLTTIQQRAEHE